MDYYSWKRDLLRDIIAVSETSEISDTDACKEAWLEEQRHKWMCGEQPKLPWAYISTAEALPR
jgi:hypothetical protein